MSEALAASGGERYRTTIHYWRGAGEWRAREPDAGHEITGRGATRFAALRDYIARVEEVDE